MTDQEETERQEESEAVQPQPEGAEESVSEGAEEVAADRRSMSVRENGPRDVTVPADMLSEALVQLKKLATLRQQESERQQLAMVRMEEQMKRHSRMNRLVLFSSAVVLLALVVTGFLLRDLVAGEKDVRAGLSVVNDGLGDTARSVRHAAAEQVKRIDGVNETLEAAKAEQIKLASRIDSSMDELRVERDAVTAEVRGVLEEKTGEFALRELELQDRAEQIRHEAVRAREARRQIIGDAIQKLAALENAAPVDLPAVPGLSMQPDVGLGSYKLKTGPVEIAGVMDDASGVTFNPDSGTLFAVLNDPTHVYELGPDGATKRVIDLDGFEDTEGITYLGAGQFAVVEERRRNLCLFGIDADTRTVKYAEALKINVDPEPAQNMGLEGVAFDDVNGLFYIVKEKNPRRIYRLPLPKEGETAPSPTEPWDIEENGFGFSDLSDLWVDANTGHLLILSDESKCIVECTTEGKEVARLPLQSGSAGLKENITQPEGITMDAKGNLYIIAEPNRFYILSKD